jgi:hypothetical protein
MPWSWTDEPATEVALATLKTANYQVSRLLCTTTDEGMTFMLADGRSPDIEWPVSAVSAFGRLGWSATRAIPEGLGFRVPSAAVVDPAA